MAHICTISFSNMYTDNWYVSHTCVTVDGARTVAITDCSQVAIRKDKKFYLNFFNNYNNKYSQLRYPDVLTVLST